MKTVILLILTFACQAFAFGGNDQGKTFAFRFQPLNGESYTYETSSDSRDDAYEKAATACFQHYKKGRRISMEQGMDIIDICANPRSI